MDRRFSIIRLVLILFFVSVLVKFFAMGFLGTGDGSNNLSPPVVSSDTNP